MKILDKFLAYIVVAVLYVIALLVKSQPKRYLRDLFGLSAQMPAPTEDEVGAVDLGAVSLVTRQLPVALFCAFLGLGASVARGQATPTLTFTAQVTAGAGSVVPVLTWSTTPAADSCTASGTTDWTGTKTASGTATLPAITTARTYNFQCTWLGSIKLSWTPPTLNTDNTPFTNPAGYRIYYGQVIGNLNQVLAINDPAAVRTTITGLTAGSWSFRVTAINTKGVESDRSPIVTGPVTTGVVTKQLTITVDPKPATMAAPVIEP